MSENKQKQYINGLWASEKTFDGGGSIIKLSILQDKFIEQIKSLKPNEKGYIKLVLSKKKTPDETSSHSLYVDDWVAPSQNKPVATKSVSKPAPKLSVEATTDDNDF